MSKVKRRALVLISLSMVSLAMITYQHRTAAFSSLRGLSYPFDLLNSATESGLAGVRDLFSTFEENRRLKRELETAQLERQRFSEVLKENRRLRDLLGLRDQLPNYLVTARVVGRGYDRFLNTLLLDKGAADGIKEGMAVITPKGLVGKVYLAGADFSRVLLMRDPNFGAAVRMRDSRVEGVLSGDSRDLCIVKYVPFEAPVEKGEELVTSGLDGVFPPGVPVGVVEKVEKEGVTFFQHIEVLPFQADSTLEEVVVLSSLKEPRRPLSRQSPEQKKPAP